jgi:SAM-dependent methyltransferase
VRGFDPVSSFGEDVAAGYDDDLRGDEQETVDCLRRLAGDGAALEFAIGTGRIGLPLAAAGARVDGIEQSPAMIARLRAKPGGRALTVVQGDMAEVVMPRRYRLVYLVFNSIYNLLRQDDQVRCFTNAARHLDEEGLFLVEAALPGPGETWPGPTYHLDEQYVAAEEVDADRVVLDVGRYDRSTQLLSRCRLVVEAGRVRLAPIALRIAGPGELDLMARLAGLRLHARWGDWHGGPFTATSRRHISLYGR